MTDWQLYGGPFDGERWTSPAGVEPTIPPRLLGRISAASITAINDTAVAALQKGADSETARAAGLAAAFTYEIDGPHGHFVYTQGHRPATDQQEAS